MRGVVKLVLHEHGVLRGKVREDAVDIRLRGPDIFAAEDDDAVLAAAVHLDDGVGAGTRRAADMADIHPRGAKRVKEHIPVLTDDAGMENFGAGFGQSDGLIESLAAAEQVLGLGQEGFAGTDDMVHLIDVIKIDGTVIYDFHGAFLRCFFCHYRSKNAGESQTKHRR